MKICDYGCGNPAEYEFKSGKSCCSKNAGGCPEVVRKRAEKRRGYQHTEETKRKLSKARLGVELSEEWRQNISNSMRGRKNGPHSEEIKHKISQANKGNTAWNKGLTAETDDRVRQYADTQTGQKRDGNYVANKDWSGENNPWYGKARNGELSPRFNGELKNREFREYRGKVTMLTERTYQEHEELINSNGRKRTKCGHGGYQLDHIYPVAAGFENGVPPDLIAAPENLQMLSWQDNLAKGSTVSEVPESIATYLKGTSAS